MIIPHFPSCRQSSLHKGGIITTNTQRGNYFNYQETMQLQVYLFQFIQLSWYMRAWNFYKEWINSPWNCTNWLWLGWGVQWNQNHFWNKPWQRWSKRSGYYLLKWQLSNGFKQEADVSWGVSHGPGWWLCLKAFEPVVLSEAASDGNVTFPRAAAPAWMSSSWCEDCHPLQIVIPRVTSLPWDYMHEIDPFSLCYEQSGQAESILG